MNKNDTLVSNKKFIHNTARDPWGHLIITIIYRQLYLDEY